MVDAGSAQIDHLGRLRAKGMIALLAGAVGSVGFLFQAGRRSEQPFVVVLIAGWVLAPFTAMALATLRSGGWSVLTRKTLYILTLLLTLVSLVIYGHDVVSPPKAQAAFVWVIVPVASWLVIAAVLPAAAFFARRRSDALR